MNFFHFLHIVVRLVTLNGALINHRRFFGELSVWDRLEANEEYGCNETDNVDLFKVISFTLKQPIYLARLIKQHYQTSDWFVVYVCVASCLIIYEEIKIIIQTFVVGDDEELLRFCNTILYPSLTGASKHPAKYNKIFILIMTLSFSFWFKGVYHLIEGSIKNSHRYNDLSLTQLNLAYICSHKPPLLKSRWSSGLLNAFLAKKFDKRKQYQAALSSWNSEILDKVLFLNDRIRFKSLIFQYNLIDFNECHKIIEFCYIIPECEYCKNTASIDKTTSYEAINHFSEKSLNDYDYRSHTSYPVHRVSPTCLWLILFYGQVTIFWSIFLLGAFVGLLILLEITDGDPEYFDKGKFDINDFARLYEIPRFVRLNEFSIVALMFSTILSTIHNYIWDCLILTSRIDRVRHLVDSERKRLKRISSQSNAIIYKENPCTFKGEELAEARLKYLNILLRTLLLEFRDVKKRYSNAINLIVVGAGITIPQNLSIYVVNKHPVESRLCLIFVLTSFLPIILLLGFSALIEISVSRRI